MDVFLGHFVQIPLKPDLNFMGVVRHFSLRLKIIIKFR